MIFVEKTLKTKLKNNRDEKSIILLKMRPDFRQVIDAVVQSAQYASELEPNPVSNPELMKKISLYLDLRASEVVKFLRPNLRFWWQKNTHDFKNIIKKKIHAKKIKPSSNSHKVPQNTSQPSKPRKAEADSKADPQTKPHKKKEKKATDLGVFRYSLQIQNPILMSMKKP